MNLKEVIKTFFVTKTDNFSKIEAQRIKRRFFEIRKMEHLWDENREILENPIELSKFIGTLDIISFTGSYNYTGLCEKCNSETSFVSIGRGFKKYCSKECMNESKKEINILRFGGNSPMSCEKVKSKVKETNILKYGGNTPMSCEKVKSKVKETNLEKYGYENVFQVPRFKEKANNSRLERYGYMYTLQNPIHIENMKKHFKETGRWYNYEKYTEFQLYKLEIERFQFKFIKEIKELKNFELRGPKTTDYHLDHMISKHYGFINKIPAEKIGHICNLEMILGSKNLSKNKKCSQTLEDLNKKIEEYNKLLF